MGAHRLHRVVRRVGIQRRGSCRPGGRTPAVDGAIFTTAVEEASAKLTMLYHSLTDSRTSCHAVDTLAKVLSWRGFSQKKWQVLAQAERNQRRLVVRAGGGPQPPDLEGSNYVANVKSSPIIRL
jgi:hypothetical protein